MLYCTRKTIDNISPIAAVFYVILILITFIFLGVFLIIAISFVRAFKLSFFVPPVHPNDYKSS